jgi:hypothetical protein
MESLIKEHQRQREQELNDSGRMKEELEESPATSSSIPPAVPAEEAAPSSNGSCDREPPSFADAEKESAYETMKRSVCGSAITTLLCRYFDHFSEHPHASDLNFHLIKS